MTHDTNNSRIYNQIYILLNHHKDKAKKEGFNEAIEEVIKLSFRADIHPTKFLEEIEKVKK